MKIKYDGKSTTLTPLKQLMKEIFYIGRYEWDEADYGFSIVLFGHEWNWLIYKDKESYFEYKQEEYDRDARWQKWEYDNAQIS
jgi:hypothetical protein